MNQEIINDKFRTINCQLNDLIENAIARRDYIEANKLTQIKIENLKLHRYLIGTEIKI